MNSKLSKYKLPIPVPWNSEVTLIKPLSELTKVQLYTVYNHALSNPNIVKSMIISI